MLCFGCNHLLGPFWNHTHRLSPSNECFHPTPSFWRATCNAHPLSSYCDSFMPPQWHLSRSPSYVLTCYLFPCLTLSPSKTVIFLIYFFILQSSSNLVYGRWLESIHWGWRNKQVHFYYTLLDRKCSLMKGEGTRVTHHHWDDPLSGTYCDLWGTPMPFTMPSSKE